MKRLWSLIGLLLTGVGLIDLPGQIRGWSSFLGFVTSTEITIGAAVIGLSIIVGANFEWLRDRFQWLRDRFHKYVLTPSTAAPTERSGLLADDQLGPDIWLQDSVCYVVHGRWLGDDEKAFNNEAEMRKASEVAQRMRELAGQGKYPVWGKNDPARLHQLIPTEFWVDNQIDFLRLAADTAENVRTERATSGHSTAYFSLKVNKSRTERIWPVA